MSLLVRHYPRRSALRLQRRLPIRYGLLCARFLVSDMYTLGQGTAKDPELAAFYGKKAAEQKRDRERQEDRADRAADRAAMTGFVMGAVFGAVWF